MFDFSILFILERKDIKSQITDAPAPIPEPTALDNFTCLLCTPYGVHTSPYHVYLHTYRKYNAAIGSVRLPYDAGTSYQVQ